MSVRPGQRPLWISLITRLLTLMLLALGIPAGAHEPLWGEVASTLGKRFVDITSQGLLQAGPVLARPRVPVHVRVRRLPLLSVSPP
jgi:hypothetical protein